MATPTTTTSTTTTNPKNKSLEEVLDDLCSRFIINLPNEELESFDRLCFQMEAAHWFYLDFFREEMPKLPIFNLKEFVRQMFQHCPLLHPYRGSVDQILANFTQYKVRVPACGAIILNPTLDKCLLVKGWTNRSSWGFPKGKINKDELEADCAIREVFEETSFDISPYLKPEDHIELILRETEQRVKLFIIAPIPETTPFFPRTRKEISKISWFPISEFTVDKSSTQLTGTEKKFPLTSPSSIASAAIAPASATNKSKNYFMVIPFINKLKAWIAKRKKHSRKNLHSPDNNIITAYDNSTTTLPIPTSPIPTPSSPLPPPPSTSSVSAAPPSIPQPSLPPPVHHPIPLPYPPPPSSDGFVPLPEPISLMHLLTPSKQHPSSPSPSSPVPFSSSSYTPPHLPTHPSPTPPHKSHHTVSSSSSSSNLIPFPLTPPPSSRNTRPPQTVPPVLPSQSSSSSSTPSFSTPSAKTAPSSPYTPYPLSPPSSPPRSPSTPASRLNLVLSPSDNERLKERSAANKSNNRNKPVYKKRLNYNTEASKSNNNNNKNNSTTNPFLNFSFNVDEIMKSFVQL